MFRSAYLVFVSGLFLSANAFAQATTDVAPLPWTNESELSLVTVSGNTDSESYSGKHKTTYTLDKNLLAANGRYLETKTGGVLSARTWAAGLRYERALTDWWSIYVGYGSESDIFAGYTQRDNADLGAKYFLTKSDTTIWFTELGYRHSKEMPRTTGDEFETNYGRLYTEYTRSFEKTWSFKFWAEYLPNFTTSDAYLANGEASISVMLSQVFSLKSAYLAKYQNVPTVATGKHVDSTFTTALVAKF